MEVVIVMAEDTSPVVPTEPLVRTDDFIQRELTQRLKNIEAQSDSHAISFNGPLISGADDIFRQLIEDLSNSQVGQKRLTVLLTTYGGQVEPVQRVAETIRHFYNEVWFVVPNHAYSAGTVLVMSGDRIYMDYYSRLGPIDPQVLGANGNWVPAIGYLRRWDELLTKANNGTITTAEVQIMLGFDQAELYQYEQATQQSIELLKTWLAEYKFRDWSKTETRGENVTSDMKADRAEEIASILSDADRWHSHGHGISKDVLYRDLNLRIDGLEEHPNLYELVKQYDKLSADYMRKMGASVAAHAVASGLIMF